MQKIILMLLVPAICSAQQIPISDMNQLVGKKVIVQRIPLCQPGTFNMVLNYAGKQAVVISIKPSAFLSPEQMSKLPENARLKIKDMQNSATLMVRFEDATVLDSCYAIRPDQVLNYFQLAPGETLQSQPLATQSSVSSPEEHVHEAKRGDLLSDDELKSAISGQGKDHWVEIEDMGLMAAQGNQVPRITLYMPEAILAIRALSAKNQFMTYSPSEEDKRRSLMIVAQGYAGKTIAEGCTSITRVVLLSDPSGTVVREPYLSEPLTETWRNALGATSVCQALRVKFSLDDVQKVRTAAPSGEFFVAVFSGTIRSKVYKIKRKFQSKLGLI